MSMNRPAGVRGSSYALMLVGGAAVWLALLGGGCLPTVSSQRAEHSRQEAGAEQRVPPVYRDFGAPLAGLSAEELRRFDEGRKAFKFPYNEDLGLGPIFNMISCFTCHDEPEPGGSSGFMTVTLFGRVDESNVFDPMTSAGGPVHQRFAVSQECKEVIPPEASIRAVRATTPLFGTGLIEAIPDETILAMADPDDADGDGISGRPHMVYDIAEQRQRVGRFGWKAQVATLVTFSAAALASECGITNRLFPDETLPNGNRDLLATCDLVPDLEEPPDENGISAFDRMADFQRLLAPPPPSPDPDPRGSELFGSLGCAACP
ncbi:MAG: hypothetical protein IID39_01605, partial [Planctomycetes bacterium]|nr:hypothetical protein [Planctomycetota bacterium]